MKQEKKNYCEDGVCTAGAMFVHNCKYWDDSISFVSCGHEQGFPLSSIILGYNCRSEEARKDWEENNGKEKLL